MHVVIAVNAAWNAVNFRAGLIAGLIAAGHRVSVIAPEDGHGAAVEAMGARMIALPMDATGTSARRDAAFLARLLRILRRERPDALLGFTPKCNIWGGIAARRLRLPFVANVAGLGTAFGGPAWLTALVKRLYKTAFARADRVFFQNRDDLATFRALGLVGGDRAGLLPGSGVDLARFAPCPLPAAPRFLLVARLLWAKGIAEYVAAARAVAAETPEARFALLGILDEANAAGIPRSVVEAWAAEGPVAWLGAADDVRPHIAAASVMVLPTAYREGTPRALLEGAAMGRPLITTDMPGARDLIRRGEGATGVLCRPGDAGDLARAMRAMIAAGPEGRAGMGRAARAMAEAEYDERLVLEAYLETLARIGG